MKTLDLLKGTWTEAKPSKRKSPEAAVGRAVDDFLRRLGGYVRTINSGGTLRGGKWTSSGQGAGIADRLCWLRDGKFIAIELKAPGKKRTVSDQQYDFLSSLIFRGHRACVADSVECVRICLTQNIKEMQDTLDKLKAKTRCRPQERKPELWEE